MIHSFLLAGQSNMAGRGIIGQVPPISDERLLALRNGRWQPMYQPVNGDRPFSGVCLAESFALRYAQEHGVQVGLIPCADGGASLLQWREGAYYSTTRCIRPGWLTAPPPSRAFCGTRAKLERQYKPLLPFPFQKR